MRTSHSEPPPALARHLVFAGSDIDEAREAVGRVFCSHSIRQRDVRERLEVRQYAARVGEVTISHIRYGASVDIAAGDIDRFFCVQLPMTGAAEIESGRDRMLSDVAHASVPTPSERLTMRWGSDASQLIVKVDESAVERHLGRLLGRKPTEPVRPLLDMNVGAGQGARWRAIQDLVLAEVAVPQSPNPSASAAAIEELVLTTLLLGHPNNYWEDLRRPPGFAAPRYVRRAIEYAHQNLDQPLTVGELAAVSGISVRALQAGFHRSIGCSPTTWIRDRRLDRARWQLEAAEPGDGTTVTDVALRWGFSHFGRFSQVYSRRFGERPSDTLKR